MEDKAAAANVDYFAGKRARRTPGDVARPIPIGL
jgi:hypothetical protein